ncbi:MAG: UvrD-helicase domain-containing protein, partial [Planctomycetota bacterium]
MSKLLDGLNPPQKEAVLTSSGPLLVLAGAGTGKTRVVTFRIARLIAGARSQPKIKPERILAVTFTNKAANEMQERVRGLMRKRTKEEPEISTFHSLCVRILRRNIEHLGYPPKFSIYAAGQQESLARKVLREVSVSSAALKPSELMYRISQWKSRGLSPEQAASVCETDKDHLAAMAYRRYQSDIRARGAVDFDDLLLCTEQLFREFPEVRRAEAGRFDHILVDEYQDTNECQYQIVRALAAGHRNLCVVGDDDQSIYSWRGAEVEHILKFASDWPEAKVVRLEDNYRSTEAILSFANRLIKFNKVRHDKVLRAARPNGDRPMMYVYKDEEEEAEQVVGAIRSQVAHPDAEYRDFAILFRTNEQPRAFESELRKHKVPYVLIGGMSFFDRREVRDTMAYMRLLDNPQEEVSLLRVLNTPPRGIG